MTVQNTVVADQMTGIGDRIRLAREQTGVGTVALANRLGVTELTLKRWETGTSSPRSNRLPVLAGTSSVPMRWLMSSEGDLPEPALVKPLPSPAKLELLNDLRNIRQFTHDAVYRLDQIERRLQGLALVLSDDDDAFI